MKPDLYIGWSWPALAAGHMHCWRGPLPDGSAVRLRKRDIVEAWTHPPDRGGRRVGAVKLTCDPECESTLETPYEDWERSGWAYLEEHRFLLPAGSVYRAVDALWTEFIDRREADAWLWTVRFKPVDIEIWALRWVRERLRRYVDYTVIA